MIIKLYSLIIIFLLTSCSWGKIFYYNESFDPQFQEKKEVTSYPSNKIYYPVRVGQIYKFLSSKFISKKKLNGLRVIVKSVKENNLLTRDWLKKRNLLKELSLLRKPNLLAETRFKIIGLCRYYNSGPNQGGSTIRFVAKVLNGKFKGELFLSENGPVSFWNGFVVSDLNKREKTFSYILWYYFYFIKNGFKEIRELGSITAYDKNYGACIF